MILNDNDQNASRPAKKLSYQFSNSHSKSLWKISYPLFLFAYSLPEIYHLYLKKCYENAIWLNCHKD